MLRKINEQTDVNFARRKKSSFSRMESCGGLIGFIGRGRGAGSDVKYKISRDQFWTSLQIKSAQHTYTLVSLFSPVVLEKYGEVCFCISSWSHPAKWARYFALSAAWVSKIGGAAQQHLINNGTLLSLFNSVDFGFGEMLKCSNFGVLYRTSSKWKENIRTADKMSVEVLIRIFSSQSHWS